MLLTKKHKVMIMMKSIIKMLIISVIAIFIIGCENPEAVPNVSNSPPTSLSPSPSFSPSKTPILPTEFLKDPLNGMVVQADVIVFGNISAQRYETVAQGDRGGSFTYTYSTLSVDKILKGDPNSRQIIIKTAGIAVGVTNIQLAEKLLICLHKGNDNIYTPEPGPMPTSGMVPIDSTTGGIIWEKSSTVSTSPSIENALGRVIQIMRANQIPVALPIDQWPSLPTEIDREPGILIF
jgi:hypothetical protein